MAAVHVSWKVSFGAANSNCDRYAHGVVVSNRRHVPTAAATEPAELADIFGSSGFVAGHTEVRTHLLQLGFGSS